MPDPYRKLTAAVDRLTTQARRIADAMPTPVTDATDTPTTTPDDGRLLGPVFPISLELAEQRTEAMAMLERYVDSRMPDDENVPPAPPAEQEQLRTARRDGIGILLSRARRGVLSNVEGGLLAEHIEEEMRQRDNLASSYSRLTEMCSAYSERAIENGERAEQAEAHSAVCREDAEHNATRAERAEQQRDQLRATLADVLRHFTHKGHPSEQCLQTGWIAERTVAEWRAALYPPAAEKGAEEQATRRPTPFECQPGNRCNSCAVCWS